jgi:hypothetical protein
MEDVATSVGAGNKSLVRDRFDAWAQGNGSPFELLADNASWTIEGGSVASKTYVDRKTFMREVIRPFNARISVQTPWLFELHDGKVTRASAMFDCIEFNDFWSRVSPAQQ